MQSPHALEQEGREEASAQSREQPKPDQAEVETKGVTKRHREESEPNCSGKQSDEKPSLQTFGKPPAHFLQPSRARSQAGGCELPSCPAARSGSVLIPFQGPTYI